MYFVYCILCTTVYCILYIGNCILYIVYCILYIVYCILYTVHRTDVTDVRDSDPKIYYHRSPPAQVLFSSVAGGRAVAVVVVVVDSHIQRILLATEETMVTQQVRHRPIKCQSRCLWSQRGTKVNGSHRGDNPLHRPSGIQIATKSYATLQAMAPTNIKTVHETSLLHIESSLDRLGLFSRTHDQRSQHSHESPLLAVSWDTPLKRINTQTNHSPCSRIKLGGVYVRQVEPIGRRSCFSLSLRSRPTINIVGGRGGTYWSGAIQC